MRRGGHSTAFASVLRAGLSWSAPRPSLQSVLWAGLSWSAPECAEALAAERAAGGSQPECAEALAAARAACGPQPEGAEAQAAERAACGPQLECAEALAAERAEGGPQPECIEVLAAERAAGGPQPEGAEAQAAERAGCGPQPECAEALGAGACCSDCMFSGEAHEHSAGCELSASAGIMGSAIGPGSGTNCRSTSAGCRTVELQSWRERAELARKLGESDLDRSVWRRKSGYRYLHATEVARSALGIR